MIRRNKSCNVDYYFYEDDVKNKYFKHLHLSNFQNIAHLQKKRHIF